MNVKDRLGDVEPAVSYHLRSKHPAKSFGSNGKSHNEAKKRRSVDTWQRKASKNGDLNSMWPSFHDVAIKAKSELVIL